MSWSFGCLKESNQSAHLPTFISRSVGIVQTGVKKWPEKWADAHFRFQKWAQETPRKLPGNSQFRVKSVGYAAYLG